MSRLWFRALYFAQATVRGLRATPVVSGVAIVTIGVSLVLVGAAALVLANMERLIEEFGEEFHVTVWLADGVSDERRAELARDVAGLEGVAEVRVVSEEEALERFRHGVGRGAALLEGLKENPLPASLELVLAPGHRSAAGIAAMAERVRGLEGVADLGAGADWVESYLRAISLVRGVGWGLGAVVALASLLIVANTIRLAIYARRDELEILSLVGATRTLVYTPFLLEGAVEGAAGGGLALALLFGLFHLVLRSFDLGLELLVGAAPGFFTPVQALSLVGAGAALGLLGSAAALSGSFRP